MAGAMGRQGMTQAPLRMLVTRPEPDAAATLSRLAALDIEGVAAPLMVRETLDISLPPPDGFAAIVLTSANAVRSLLDRKMLDHYRHLPVLAVGDRTAREATEVGFERVSSAAGTVKDLVNAVSLSGLQGPLFYPTGRHQSTDLSKALAPAGVMVVTARLYDMVGVEQLPAPVLEQLGTPALEAVLIYSRRTAEIFVALTGSLPPERRAALCALCLSEAAAEPLLEAHFNRINLADRPDEDAMMTLALAFRRERTAP
jgi:uroporphyrinogen-III synthase